MTGTRLAVLAGAGALVLTAGAAPGRAAEALPDLAPPAPTALPGQASPGPDSGALALALLADAAQAVRTLSWSGTSSVSTWTGGTRTTDRALLRHDPAASPAPGGVLDERLLVLLGQRYRLRVADVAVVGGRAATVVEARRLSGSLAARYWLDRRTGLPLGQDVFAPGGGRVRSSALELLAEPAPAAPAALRRTRAAVRLPERAAWAVPAQLPGGFTLYDASRPVHDGVAVLHLAYSDGLSTVSVFSQPGTLGALADRGYGPRRLDGGTVWVRPGVPARAVWSGGGQVFTLVSDLPGDDAADVLALVRGLPRDADERTGGWARLGRGVHRVGSWLDPSR